MSVLAHLPGVTYGAPPDATGASLAVPPRLIVIHATDNATATARDEAHYAANRGGPNDPQSRWTSAHFYVDDNEVVGSQSLLMQAWGCYSGNRLSWQIEACGRSGALSTATTNRAADLVRALAMYGGIPIVKLSPGDVRNGAHGVCGHADITLAFPADGGMHTDPGWGAAQWTAFITRAKGTAVMEQIDRLTFPSVNNVDRRIGNVFTDLGNLRDWLIDPNAKIADGTWPAPGSPLAKLMAFLNAPASTVTLSAADRADIAGQVAAALKSDLDALRAEVADLRTRLANGAAAQHDALTD